MTWTSCPRVAVSLLLLLLISRPGAAAIEPARLVAGFGHAVIFIESSALRCIRLEVRVAETPEQRSQGLMHVRSMTEFTGMLFLFPGEGILAMWMQNTHVPLDMLFLRSDGSIASIAADTVPLSTRRISSGEPVASVLELNAGFSRRWHIEPGNRVRVWRDDELLAAL